MVTFSEALDKCRWRKVFALCLAIFLSAFQGQTYALESGESTLSDGTKKAGHYSPQDLSFVHRFLKASEYMPVSEIKPGMEGYGLTVFQGTKVEKFPCRVIGVVKQVLNGRDAILLRLSGPHMVSTNVVRGMSGSPIYIQNRLCGALSYGFDFSKEPIVGVTPVVDMLDALTFDAQSGKPRHLSVNPHTLKAQPLSLPGSAIGPTTTLSGGKLVPLMAPVSLSGYSRAAQSYLAEKFSELGLSAASGASGGLAPELKSIHAPELKSIKAPEQKGPELRSAAVEKFDTDRKVQPGSAVSVMLSTGDFATAATGTATCTFGNKFIAFGHSFLEAGSVSFPLASAYIHEVLPALSVSFKLASPMEVIGTIFADRPWSVGGEVGRMPQLIPLKVTVTDESRNVRKVYNCKIADHPEVTPALVTATIMSALDSTFQSQAPYMVKVKSEIDIKGKGRLEKLSRMALNFNAHQSSGDLLLKLKLFHDPVSTYLGGMVERIVDNDYENAKVTNLNFDLTIEDGRKLSRIERISLDKANYAPGETATVSCLLRPYSGENYVEKLSFPVPRDVPDGDLALGICGGDELDSLRKRLGVADPAPESLDEIIGRLKRRPSAEKLCGVLALPRQSLYFAGSGKVLKNPPAHWLKLFFSERCTKPPALVKAESFADKDLGDIIDGSHVIALTVKRRDKVFLKALPYTFSPLSQHSDGMYITEQAKKALESSRKSDTKSDTTASTSSTDTKAQPPLWSIAQSYPHMRAISLWRQDSEEAFRNGFCQGVSVDSLGRLRPGYSELSCTNIDNEARVLCGATSSLPGQAPGNFYFAAGNNIYKSNGDAVEKLTSLDGMLVTAMAAAGGKLYFALAPGCAIWSSTLSGSGELSKPSPLVTLDGDLITALCCDGEGRLLAGVSGGKLYRLDSSGQTKQVFELGAAHITALSYSPSDKRVYVGTAEKGAVFSLGEADLRAEYETSEHIVTGCVRDLSGNLFITTAGQGKLLRLSPSKQLDVVAYSDAFYTLYYDPKLDRVFAGDGEGDITTVEIDPLTDQAHFLPVYHTEQDAVSVLGSDPGKLYAACSNVAQVRSFAISPTVEPTYTSIAFDAQKTAVWSRLRLYGKNEMAVESQNFQVESRGGETSQPDSSWSAWVTARADAEGYRLGNRPSRYLQYRLTWKQFDKKFAKDDAVWRVETTYQPADSAPQISSISLKPNEALSGSPTITLNGSDADLDNMLLQVELSPDGGKTWKTIASDIRSRGDSAELKKKMDKKAKVEPGKVDSKGDPKNGTATQDKSHAKTENLPEKEHPQAGAPEPIKLGKLEEDFQPVIPNQTEKPVDKPEDKKADEKTEEKKTEEKPKDKVEKAAEAFVPTEKFSYVFDTKKEKDGSYLMRFTLSDRPSNPNFASVRAIRKVIIDNSEPTIKSHKLWRENGLLSISLTAFDGVSSIADGTYKIDQEEAFALAPTGGILGDSASVELQASGIPMVKSGKKVTLEVFDRAGNVKKVVVNAP